MEHCELSSHEMYSKLIKVFPELEDWTQKDITEIKKFLKKNSVVLEIGCSWGRVIRALAPYCKKFVGIDNSSIEIEEAKSFLKDVPNVDLYLEDGKKTHFQNEFFDIIIIVGNTFGNLGENKELVLQEMKRILKKDGKILLSVYSQGAKAKRLKAYKDIGMKIKTTKNKKIVFGGGLISEEFSKAELKSIFEKFGLKVQFIDLCKIAVLCIISK
ncbi:MAG: class I SAM-dependent methyltransferase [Nanoarchaeota archaeon]